MTIKNDNRMLWIRNIEEIVRSNDNAYYTEYEFVSECYISGCLDYENEKIICAGFSMEEDKNGLYHYLLKIQYPKAKSDYNNKADEKGYCFPDETIGELLSLFSLYFQCRFYIVAAYYGASVNRGLKQKKEYDYFYKKVSKNVHPGIFSENERKFSKGLPDFLDLVKSLDSQKHQGFMLACFHYARSLKEIGIDSEMVFIRLVSAIEILSESYKLSEQDNPLDGKVFSNLFDVSRLSEKQNNQLKEILGVGDEGKIQIRKSQRKFIRFINDFSRGCLRGGNHKAKHLKITRKKLPNVLNVIYKARSKYLHVGKPMYLSQFMHEATKWDTDPSLGMVVDNRKFLSSEKLPYTFWFENLVRDRKSVV